MYIYLEPMNLWLKNFVNEILIQNNERIVSIISSNFKKLTMQMGDKFVEMVMVEGVVIVYASTGRLITSEVINLLL